MSRDFTLPSLEALLDELPLDRSLARAKRQVEQLFGFNDVAATRLKRFARSHDCIVAHANDCVVLRKVPSGH